MAKKTVQTIQKISSTQRLEDLLKETEEELSTLEPQIEKLEKQLEKLKELRLAKQKLITLKLSIKSILANFNENEVDLNAANLAEIKLSPISSIKKSSSGEVTSSGVSGTSSTVKPAGTFFPDQAFRDVNAVLRKRTSLNYELFRAIVFNGGMASTEEIKQYLVENAIKQPASGEGFEQVELTDISSRVNYLVRKGIVNPDGRGTFISNLGWAG